MSKYKGLLMLVGNPGSGKTTVAMDAVNKNGFLRISQDDQGKAGHWTAFEKALKNEHGLIVIDRLNHTKEQRAKFLIEAKKHGYETIIQDMTCTPKLAFDRIIKRENHPTLGKDDKDSILKALYMYYSQYEKPTLLEADVVTSLASFNPYMLDLTDELKNDKYIVVGDIHGCYHELDELLCKAPLYKAVIATGDIVDRGPKIKQVLMDFMFDKSLYSVMGNHEYKLLRYYLGNKVNISKDLKKSIDQLDGLDKHTIALFLMSLPKMIRIENTYIVHAGIEPKYPIEKQGQHALLYARDWVKDIPQDNKLNIFFGHHYYEKVNVAPNVYALDGHAVYGKELRAMVMPTKQLITQKAFETYAEKVDQATSVVAEFEQEVQNGNVRRAVKDDLVLYCYTEKCNYEKNWTDITKQARGVIFNRVTGECIARPFYKFFNLGEVEETQLINLPKESYEVFDKVDGSLGILYWQGDTPMIATKGSFDSPQAHEAMKIMRDKSYDVKLKTFDRNITLLFEIIYPENRTTPGAMLVTDYGKTRDLILLAAINKKINTELSWAELQDISEKYGFPLVTKYNHTIEEMIEMQKTLPKEREGFVVKFANRLRVKIKGDEYMKIHRLLNNMTPLFLWENMKGGLVPQELKIQVPEEYRSYMEEITLKLETKYKEVWSRMLTLMEQVHPEWHDQDVKNRDFMKSVGLMIKEKQFEFAEVVFPMLLGKEDVVEKLIMKKIRPNSNIL